MGRERKQEDIFAWRSTVARLKAPGQLLGIRNLRDSSPPLSHPGTRNQTHPLGKKKKTKNCDGEMRLSPFHSGTAPGTRPAHLKTCSAWSLEGLERSQGCRGDGSRLGINELGPLEAEAPPTSPPTPSFLRQ